MKTSSRSLVLGCGLLLGACGAVDHNVSYVPEALRQPGQQTEPEQPPDVAAILRGNPAAVFTQTSAPSQLRYSFPVPAKLGGWDSCVRGAVNGVTGQALGMQTVLVNIDHGKVGRRERVGNDHWCARETYQPL
jgi:hypothetical protein